jgi:voltage-dependent potassium channel beta subunit
MQYRRLGNAGLKVSVISLGSWINFGENKVAADVARRVVESAYEHGVNFFDTADFYGRGEAEKQLGEIIRPFPRHTLVLSSKVFAAMSDDINDHGLSRKHIMESIGKSLKRLGTDYLDIYFCHRPDPETPLLETVRALQDLIQQGKILYWGTSNWSALQIVEAYTLCEQYGFYTPQVEQAEYSLLRRERLENELLPVTEPRGIGLLAWSPLAQGMLTGKYDEGISAGSRFQHEQLGYQRYFSTFNVERVRRLRDLAESLHVTRAQLALAWALRHSSLSSVITGATTELQLRDNLHAADIRLSEETIAQIELLMSSTSG